MNKKQTRNRKIILVSGSSSTGKTASLMDIKKDNVLYLGCESDKDLPFKSGNNITIVSITHPKQVKKEIKKAVKSKKYKYIVIDTITFLMDMFESEVIRKSSNTMEEWGNYAEYFRTLMQSTIAKAKDINFILMGHTTILDGENGDEVGVKVKGSLMTKGIEAFFNNVISTKKVDLDELEEYDNKLLKITKQDEVRGFKYVFQTQLTAETKDERIRSPMGMWKENELYIDNNIVYVMDRLKSYYK